MKNIGTATVTGSKGVKLPDGAGKARKRSKYGNKITEVNGIKFHSKKEAKRWQELKMMESYGHISNLRRQVRYELFVNAIKIGHYTADFVYEDPVYIHQDGRLNEIVEDVKSESTAKDEAYGIRKRLMKALYGIDIRET